MKKIIILVFCFCLCFFSCATKVESTILLPDVPQRKYINISEPYTDQELTLYIMYQDHLIKEWEFWGVQAQSTVKKLNKIISKTN